MAGSKQITRISNMIRRSAAAITTGIALLVGATYCAGAINESQVLVVYNSAAAEATPLKDAYLAAHPGIPAANVVDLNSATLVSNPATITYAQFKSEIRDPIRSYLDGGFGPTASSIIAMALIRPLPHRISDSDFPLAGDNGTNSGNEANAGDATFSSVDSELVLLWQNLDVGEAGGTMDSLSDNMIDNPYHQATFPINSCGTCSRANIKTAKVFTNNFSFFWGIGGTGATRLTVGDLYLVCRLDGTTLADAINSIDRAQNLRINKANGIVLLDEYNVNGGADDLDDDGIGVSPDPFNAGDDYESTETLMLGNGWTVRYDGTGNFIDSTEETRPIIAYASYGENHDRCAGCEDPPGNATYIDGFRFPRGAIFNTIESDNGRALNGLGSVFGLEQVADFIRAGGTFGLGNVWEPFSFTTPDNRYLLASFLVLRRTWAEAAYSSLPALSWQQIVVGDPLATPQVVSDPGLPLGDLNGDGNVDGLDIEWYVDLVLNGPLDYYAAFPTLDPVIRCDFDGDFYVTLDDLPGFINVLLTI